MREITSQAVERQRVSVVKSFSRLKTIFPEIFSFLKIEVPTKDNKGLFLRSDIQKKNLLKKSFESIMTQFPGIVAVQSTLRDAISKINPAKNANTLRVLIQSIKKFSTKCANLPKEKLMVEINRNSVYVKQDIEEFLKYVINLLRLEEQSLIEKVTDDTDIETKVLDDNGVLQNKNYSYEKIKKKAFSTGISKPSYKHIEQGYVGDCYLLSSLMSIAKMTPDKITKCFVNRDTIDNEDKVKIRFFKVKLESRNNAKGEEEIVAVPTGKIVVTIQKTVLKDSSGGRVHNQKIREEALWVPLIEKAFMLYKNNTGCVTTTDANCNDFMTGWNKKKNDYIAAGSLKVAADSISGGYAFIAMAAITGNAAYRNMSLDRKLSKRTKSKKFPVGGVYSTRAETLYKFFKDKIAQNKTITVSTKSDTFKHRIPKKDGTARTIWTDKDGNPKAYPGIDSGHAYAVVEKVDEGPGPMRDATSGKLTATVGGKFKFICIRNPHADKGFENYIWDVTKGKIKREQAFNKGKLRIELNDFLKYFKCYDVMD